MTKTVKWAGTALEEYINKLQVLKDDALKRVEEQKAIATKAMDEASMIADEVNKTRKEIWDVLEAKAIESGIVPEVKGGYHVKRSGEELIFSDDNTLSAKSRRNSALNQV